MTTFNIDYGEWLILIEAAWIDGTISRNALLKQAIGMWHDKMTINERKHTYEFFIRTKGDRIETETQRRFMARYNPDNQFAIIAQHGDIEQWVNAYLFEGKYWTTESQFVPAEYITSIEKG